MGRTILSSAPYFLQNIKQQTVFLEFQEAKLSLTKLSSSVNEAILWRMDVL
jgi:hypothetical protein